MQPAAHRHSHRHKHRHKHSGGSPGAAAIKTWLKSAGHAVTHHPGGVQQHHSRSAVDERQGLSCADWPMADAWHNASTAQSRDRCAASLTLTVMPCRFYSDEDEAFYDCSSRRSSSADVADAMAGLKTASGSSDRSQDGNARIQSDTDWIECASVFLSSFLSAMHTGQYKRAPALRCRTGPAACRLKTSADRTQQQQTSNNSQRSTPHLSDVGAGRRGRRHTGGSGCRRQSRRRRASACGPSSRKWSARTSARCPHWAPTAVQSCIPNRVTQCQAHACYVRHVGDGVTHTHPAPPLRARRCACRSTSTSR